MRPARVAVAAGMALALLGGCSRTTGGSASPAGAGAAAGQPDTGVAALPPVQILARARAALANASSVHIHGSGRSAGQPLSLDLRIAGKDGATGTMTLPTAADGSTEKVRIELIVIGATAYLKGSRLLWLGLLRDQSIVDKLAGKWVRTSVTTERVKPLLATTDLAELAKELVKPENRLAAGTAKQIRGVRTVGVVDQGATGSTVYVATQGQPVPVQIVATGQQESVLDFTEYGEPVELAAPDPADVVDGRTVGL